MDFVTIKQKVLKCYACYNLQRDTTSGVSRVAILTRYPLFGFYHIQLFGSKAVISYFLDIRSVKLFTTHIFDYSNWFCNYQERMWWHVTLVTVRRNISVTCRERNVIHSDFILFYPAESLLGSKIINSSFLNLDTVLTFVFHHLKWFCNHQNKNSLILVTMWRNIRCVTCSEHDFVLNILCWIIAWEKNEFLLYPEIIHCFNFFSVSLIIWSDFVTTKEKKQGQVLRLLQRDTTAPHTNLILQRMT